MLNNYVAMETGRMIEAELQYSQRDVLRTFIASF